MNGDYNMERKPLNEHEVVVHVPQGQAKNVKIQELPPNDTAPAEITVQVSKSRKTDPKGIPVFGVIVK